MNREASEYWDYIPDEYRKKLGRLAAAKRIAIWEAFTELVEFAKETVSLMYNFPHYLAFFAVIIEIQDTIDTISG